MSMSKFMAKHVSPSSSAEKCVASTNFDSSYLCKASLAQGSYLSTVSSKFAFYAVVNLTKH